MVGKEIIRKKYICKYQIKKGMALNPFKTYRNQNKNLTRKSIRKGGKKRTRKRRRRRKRTKKKKRRRRRKRTRRR